MVAYLIMLSIITEKQSNQINTMMNQRKSAHVSQIVRAKENKHQVLRL